MIHPDRFKFLKIHFPGYSVIDFSDFCTYFTAMKKNTLLLLLLAAILLNACKKEDKPIPLNSDKELLSFQIKDSLNSSYLETSITGTITGTEIKLTIPELVDASKLVATFSFKGASVFVGAVEQQSGVTVNDFTKLVTYTVIAEDGSHQDYTVKIETSPLLKNGVPQIYITTENGVPIDSKDNYVKATLKIDGAGLYEGYEGPTSIKGRGNSTWGYPKKPYRLKLDKKSNLLGLSAEKDWILLANWNDPTLMLTAVAFKNAQLLKMPFTNHAIPVDVTINGVYAGNYTFTEQKEVEDNRINIGDDGWWLELDSYFDEPFEFRSAKYNLPVMIHNPELDKIPAADAQTQLTAIRTDFENLEQLVYDASFPNNNYLNYFDDSAFVNYWMVYDLCLNEEINHPKSTYMYKMKGGKYCMGPVWDFDWAFGYEGTYTHFSNPSKELIWNSTQPGTQFFGKIMQDPALRKLYRNLWVQFKAEKYPELLKYIDDYAAAIKDSYVRDHAKWNTGPNDLPGDVHRMKSWLNTRVAYIDSYTSGW